MFTINSKSEQITTTYPLFQQLMNNVEMKRAMHKFINMLSTQGYLNATYTPETGCVTLANSDIRYIVKQGKVNAQFAVQLKKQLEALIEERIVADELTPSTIDINFIVTCIDIDMLVKLHEC